MPYRRRSEPAFAAASVFLPRAEALLVARYASFEHLPSGTQLAAVGAYERTLTLLTDGQARAVRADGTVSELTGQPDAPAVIGELSLLRIRLHQVATVTATSDVTVLRLAGRDFDRIALRCPALCALLEPALATHRASLDASYEADRAGRSAAIAAYRGALERTAR
jgi:CRP-like cAMP-binding protein